jgi:hypothetical protein
MPPGGADHPPLQSADNPNNLDRFIHERHRYGAAE